MYVINVCIDMQKYMSQIFLKSYTFHPLINHITQRGLLSLSQLVDSAFLN